MKACKWPGCPALIQRHERYCPAHVSRGEGIDADRVRQYDRTIRDPQAVTFYRSKDWLAIRADILGREPFCRHCREQFASDVDHVIPLADNWERRLDETNLQPLCKGCHHVKSQRERRGNRSRHTI